MCVEINFRKSKWPLFAIYHPPAQNNRYIFNCIDKALHTYSNYDNVLLAGDFNAEDDEPCLSNFIYQHDLYNLVEVGTCFYNSSKPKWTDLYLTTKNKHFQNTIAVFSGLSDFRKLVPRLLKTLFDKSKPCEILYTDYKNVNAEAFNEDLQNILSTTQLNICKKFEDTCMHALLKKKLLRANYSQYVTIALRKALMKRSKLDKIYFKKKTSESLKAYKKQKNYCSMLYKKERKKYFDNHNTSILSDDQTFWKVIKPFFINKSTFGKKYKTH